MVLYLKGKYITKSLLKQEVYTLLKQEKRLDLMSLIEEKIYLAKNEEAALSEVSNFIDIR